MCHKMYCYSVELQNIIALLMCRCYYVCFYRQLITTIYWTDLFCCYSKVVLIRNYKLSSCGSYNHDWLVFSFCLIKANYWHHLCSVIDCRLKGYQQGLWACVSFESMAAKVKVENNWYGASSWGNLIWYGTHSQWIRQFYLSPTFLSMSEMNYTCLCLPCPHLEGILQWWRALQHEPILLMLALLSCHSASISWEVPEAGTTAGRVAEVYSSKQRGPWLWNNIVSFMWWGSSRRTVSYILDSLSSGS